MLYIHQVENNEQKEPVRRQGIGRALLESTLTEPREIGHRKVRLDSANFMKAAHAMYRSMGFREIEPYPESEIPEEYWEHWVFMEINLTNDVITSAGL